MKEEFNLPKILNKEKAEETIDQSFSISVEKLQERLNHLLEKKFRVKINFVDGPFKLFPVRRSEPYYNGREFTLATDINKKRCNELYIYASPDGRIYYSVYHYENPEDAGILMEQSIDSEICWQGIKVGFHNRHLTSVQDLSDNLAEIAESMKVTNIDEAKERAKSRNK